MDAGFLRPVAPVLRVVPQLRFVHCSALYSAADASADGRLNDTSEPGLFGDFCNALVRDSDCNTGVALMGLLGMNARSALRQHP